MIIKNFPLFRLTTCRTGQCLGSYSIYLIKLQNVLTLIYFQHDVTITHFIHACFHSNTKDPQR